MKIYGNVCCVCVFVCEYNISKGKDAKEEEEEENSFHSINNHFIHTFFFDSLKKIIDKLVIFVCVFFGLNKYNF